MIEQKLAELQSALGEQIRSAIGQAFIKAKAADMASNCSCGGHGQKQQQFFHPTTAADLGTGTADLQNMVQATLLKGDSYDTSNFNIMENLAPSQFFSIFGDNRSASDATAVNAECGLLHPPPHVQLGTAYQYAPQPPAPVSQL